ncbi:hypothetical protein BDV19DRAFT_385018 [Aspergillus venezuelensis]
MRVHTAFRGIIGSENDPPFGGVHALAVASIKNELETSMQDVPEDLKWNHLLQEHCAAIQIRLFEPFEPNPRNATPQATHLRCRTLWNCLQSNQALTDAFRSVSVESYSSLTFISILHIALAIIKAARLLSVEDPAWDLKTTRSMYDLPLFFNSLAGCLKTLAVTRVLGVKFVLQGRPICSEYAEAYRGIERWYATKLDSSECHGNAPLNECVDLSNEDNGMEWWNGLSELTNGLFS